MICERAEAMVLTELLAVTLTSESRVIADEDDIKAFWTNRFIL